MNTPASPRMDAPAAESARPSANAPAPVLVPFGCVAPGLEFDFRVFHDGDKALFAEVDRRLRPSLEAVTRRWARDADDADDLAQLTMIRVWEKRTAFSGRGSLLAWTWSVCTNVCREQVRQSGDAQMVALEDCEDLADPVPDLHEAMERRLRAAVVRKALARLDEREREAVLARYGEGRSPREVAQAMGIAVRAAAVLARHGLDELAGMEELAEAALDAT